MATLRRLLNLDPWTMTMKRTTPELLDTLAGRGDSGGRGIERRMAMAASGGIQRERASEGEGSEWILGFAKGSTRLLSPQGTGGWPTRGGSTRWTL